MSLPDVKMLSGFVLHWIGNAAARETVPKKLRARHAGTAVAGLSRPIDQVLD